MVKPPNNLAMILKYSTVHSLKKAVLTATNTWDPILSNFQPQCRPELREQMLANLKETSVTAPQRSM